MDGVDVVLIAIPVAVVVAIVTVVGYWLRRK